MAIAEDDIQRVRAATTLSDLVSPYTQLRRSGRSQIGLCPFHSERTGSFSVNDETGRYMCFGCGAKGDVFNFVQQTEHLDFIAAVERLAAKASIELHYTSGPDTGQRKHRKELLEVMMKAVDWYHQRLLESPDARPARDYLRSRGLSGEVARHFRIGWAPDDWDVLCKSLGAPAAMLKELGLGFENKRGRMQDFFRARVLFPIFDENGNAVAFGGRILPGVPDQAKYKNSTETPVYVKSRTLYGLNWAKGDAIKADRLVVCEGYTDVIGFHRSGVTTAVATCGTALTEEHVKLMKRYARNVVLAFDADNAGQGAAEKFYEWEKKYDITVSVAQFPEGQDPGDIANTNPDSLQVAVDEAMPFLGFRLKRLYAANPGKSPEVRARTAELAMSLVNEHPDVNVRRLYASEVAMQTGVSSGELMRIAEQGRGRIAPVAQPVRQAAEGAGFMSLALLIHDWDSIAPWLIEELFAEEPYRQAFNALAESEGDVHKALALVDGEAADIIERAAVHDQQADAMVEARTLIAAAARRELSTRVRVTDPDELRVDQAARVALADLARPERAANAAVTLLQWLADRAGATA